MIFDISDEYTTNVTFYFQYETANTNAVGSEFTETVSVDLDLPVVTFSPGNGGTNDLSNPLIQIGYYDPFGADTNATPSGLNLSTLTITLDGINVTTNFYIFPSMAIGDAAGAWVGWHTNIVALADNAGNWTFATNVFYTTGVTNTAAPVLDNLNADPGVVTLMPDVPQIWVQGTFSGGCPAISAIVNGGTPIPMNQRDDDFGYLLPIDPGTNLIVLIAQDPCGNGTSTQTILVNRTTAFQASMASPVFGTFANGQVQNVSGTVSSYTTDDGSVLPLASVLVNGGAVAGALPSGNYSTNIPPPCSVMPLIISVCWTGSTFSASYTNICADIPLGLLEGYEIVSREDYSDYPWGDADFYQYPDTNLPCDFTGWEVPAPPDNYAGRETTDTSFTLPCSPGSNVAEVVHDWADTNVCTASLLPEEMDWNVDWGSYTDSLYQLQPPRSLNFGTEYEYNQYAQTFPTHPNDNIVLREGDWLNDTGTMTVRWPFYYPPGQVVLLTFEGVGCMVFPSNQVDASQLLYNGQAPAVVTSNGVSNYGGGWNLSSFDLGYLVTKGADPTFTIDASAFTWPAFTYDELESSNGFDSGDSYVLTFHGQADYLSFSGFHNCEKPVVIADGNGNALDGTSIVAGTKVTLQAQFPCEIKQQNVISYQWSINGKTVKSYMMTDTIGNPVNFAPNDPALTQSTVDVFWIAAGSGVLVQCNVTVLLADNSSKVYTAIAKINVLAPTVTVTSGNQAVEVDQSTLGTAWYLSYRAILNHTVLDGIQCLITSSNNIPAGVQGAFEWVQTGYIHEMKLAGGIWNIGYSEGLDNAVVPDNLSLSYQPSRTGVRFYDSPYSLLSGYSTDVILNDSFNLWLMWRPGSLGDPSKIPIPLMQIQNPGWWWYGRSQLQSGSWKLVSPPGQNSGVPNLIDSSDPPKWDRNTTPIHWQY